MIADKFRGKVAGMTRERLYVDIDEDTARFFAEIRHELAELIEAVEKALVFIKALPRDCMGRDEELGYYYRDEMISRFEAALTALREKMEELG